MRPLVVDFLLARSLADLKREHGVNYRRDRDCTKVTLDYDQIDSRPGDRLAEECRGLILRPHNVVDDGPCTNNVLRYEEWETSTFGRSVVIAWPMCRFYNEGDTNAAAIAWDDVSLTVSEKLDGTMTLLYWDELKREWHVGTRGVPEADLPLNEAGLTFRQLFERGAAGTFNDRGGFDELVSRCERDITYVFELTAPENRIIVRYDEARLTLLAARSVVTGHELVPHRIAQSLGVPTPKQWPLATPTAIHDFVNSVEPERLEGAVVRDGRFRRIKVKSKAYVLSSRTKDMFSSYAIVDGILDGTMDDVIPILDEKTKEKVIRLRDGIAAYSRHMDSVCKRLQFEAGGDRKTFAMLVNSSGEWTAPLFAVNSNKATSFLEWARSAQQRRSICKQLRENVEVMLKNDQTLAA